MPQENFIQKLKQDPDFYLIVKELFEKLFKGKEPFLEITDNVIHSICCSKNYSKEEVTEYVLRSVSASLDYLETAFDNIAPVLDRLIDLAEPYTDKISSVGSLTILEDLCEALRDVHDTRTDDTPRISFRTNSVGGSSVGSLSRGSSVGSLQIGS